MKRAISVLAAAMMLTVPMALAGPSPAAAGETVTIHTKERGSEKPALYACYTLTDLPGGDRVDGGLGRFCDGSSFDADGTANGTVVVATSAECDPCRVEQGLPDKPDGTPTDYLVEPAQERSPSAPFTFRNFLKPYLVVSVRDAKTKKPVKGACIAVVDLGQGGTDFSACDGTLVNGQGDQDGRKNGKIRSSRLPNAGAFRVDNRSPYPAGYRKAKSVKVSAGPAETGEFEAVAIKPRPRR